MKSTMEGCLAQNLVATRIWLCGWNDCSIRLFNYIYIVTGLYNLMNKEIIFSITIGESLSDDSTSQTACMC